MNDWMVVGTIKEWTSVKTIVKDAGKKTSRNAGRKSSRIKAGGKKIRY